MPRGRKEGGRDQRHLGGKRGKKKRKREKRKFMIASEVFLLLKPSAEYIS